MSNTLLDIRGILCVKAEVQISLNQQFPSSQQGSNNIHRYGHPRIMTQEESPTWLILFDLILENKDVLYLDKKPHRGWITSAHGVDESATVVNQSFPFQFLSLMVKSILIYNCWKRGGACFVLTHVFFYLIVFKFFSAIYLNFNIVLVKVLEGVILYL